MPTALLHLRTHGVVVTPGFHDRILRHPSPRARAAPASGTDLNLTTPDGIPVGVTISDRYGPTPTAQQAAQNTVNLLASRVHATELAALRLYIGPPDEISSIYGAQEALARYAPDEQRSVRPGRTAAPAPAGTTRKSLALGGSNPAPLRGTWEVGLPMVAKCWEQPLDQILSAMR